MDKYKLNSPGFALTCQANVLCSVPKSVPPLKSREELRSNSLIEKCPPVYDQGNVGSCTACSLCFLWNMCDVPPYLTPSRMWLYAMERMLLPGFDGKLSDDGAHAIDGLLVMNRIGMVAEDRYPYVETMVNSIPPKDLQKEASYQKLTSYWVLDTESQDIGYNIKRSIDSGYGVSWGFLLYKSFHSKADGIIDLPKARNYDDVRDPNDPLIGGHEVPIVAYDDMTRRYTFANHWGSSWGNNGYGTVPYEYVESRLYTISVCAINTTV